MVFDGRRFTKYEGKASDKLSKSEYEQLIANCQKANLWKHEEGYGMNIMDIPTTTVHFYEDNRDKKIQWRMRAPKELPTLSDEIMELIFQRDWVEDPREKVGQILPQGTITNNIIVQLKEKNIDVQKWCGHFSAYEAKVKRTLSKSASIYLITFDTDKIEPQEMLDLIRANGQVKSASFDRQLESRNR